MSKIYIVTHRCGPDLFTPEIFKTKEEADERAKEIIYDVAINDYDGESDNPDWSELEEWAEENDYILTDTYYWRGYNDSTEILVTEHII